ncbi:hypothetical protein HMPREF1861_02049 [Corynebacterium kroppenstedtii]|nr:hypothetical protein HMPREF1861_02049 [Corynebacterium kroppenstedtii]
MLTALVAKIAMSPILITQRILTRRTLMPMTVLTAVMTHDAPVPAS